MNQLKRVLAAGLSVAALMACAGAVEATISLASAPAAGAKPVPYGWGTVPNDPSYCWFSDCSANRPGPAVPVTRRPVHPGEGMGAAPKTSTPGPSASRRHG